MNTNPPSKACNSRRTVIDSPRDMPCERVQSSADHRRLTRGGRRSSMLLLLLLKTLRPIHTVHRYRRATNNTKAYLACANAEAALGVGEGRRRAARELQRLPKKKTSKEEGRTTRVSRGPRARSLPKEKSTYPRARSSRKKTSSIPQSRA